MNGEPAKPIMVAAGGSAAQTRRTVSRIGWMASARRPRSRASKPAWSRIGGSSGPSPETNCRPWPSAQGTIRMSLNRIAASMPKRRTGCRVISVASSGVVQQPMKSDCTRSARYSGR